MTTKLFVAGLSFATTSVELEELFRPFGVAHAEIALDRVTRRSRRFAFVRIDADPETIERARVALDGTKLGDLTLHVDLAHVPGEYR